MKKIIPALISTIVVSGSAFASNQLVPPMTNGCSGTALCSLISNGGFYLGLTGLYVVPSETGLGMITDSWEYANPDGSITARNKPADIKYDFQGALNVGYDFPETANNIELDYIHLYSKTHNYNDTSDNPVAFGSIFFNVYEPITPGETLVSNSWLKYTVDQVDLNVGHRITDASGRIQIHPLIGVRYANLRHELPFGIGAVNSQFQGAGPMIGLDGEYDFCSGFGLVGRFDAAVLMGTVKADSSLNDFGSYRFHSPDTKREVTTVGGRLGVDYNYVLPNASRLKLELGYQANVYVGAFDIITGWVAPTQRISSLDTTNFSYSGPYLNLTWHA